MNVFKDCAKKIGLGLLLFSANAALAEEKANETAAFEPVSHGGKILFFLIFIIGLILMLAWLLNKSKLGSGLMSQTHPDLNVVAVLSFGVKEKIAVIQAGDKQLLVAITAQQINLLSELEEPLAEKQAQPLKFQDFLKKAMRS